MASPVPRDSVLAVEECLATITVDAMTPLPSDDDISSIPSPISSPDLPDIDEFLEYHKRLRSARDSSPSSLPNSSLPSSPVPDDNISMEGDFSSGRVHLYYKAGEGPLFFEIPSTNGFFSLLNCRTFVKQSRIITHPLEVYDAMMGDFVSLPPFAYWRQYTWDYYLIVREKGVDDKHCPGLDSLIDDLGDPVDIMSKDPICREIWRQDKAKTPPSTQIPLPVLPPTHLPTYNEQSVQTIVGQKRKRITFEDEVPEPPVKISKTFRRGNGNTSDDPIIVLDD